MNGQKIYSEIIFSHKENFEKNIDGSATLIINLSKQDKGIYFIEILSNRKRTIKKIVMD